MVAGIVGIVPVPVWDVGVVVSCSSGWTGLWVVDLVVSGWVRVSRGGVKGDKVGGLKIGLVPARSSILLSAMGVRRMFVISASVVYRRDASVCRVMFG